MAGHALETGETVMHIGKMGDPHKYINSHSIRASDVRWRQLMGYKR